MGPAGHEPSTSLAQEAFSPSAPIRQGLRGGQRPQLRGQAGWLVTHVPGSGGGIWESSLYPQTCVPHLPQSPPTPAHPGEGPRTPLTVAPMQAAPPAMRAVASRIQAQHEGCRLQSILGSKATVTARPGQARLLCRLTRVHSGEKPLGPTQCQGLGLSGIGWQWLPSGPTRRARGVISPPNGGSRRHGGGGACSTCTTPV